MKVYVSKPVDVNYFPSDIKSIHCEHENKSVKVYGVSLCWECYMEVLKEINKEE